MKIHRAFLMKWFAIGAWIGLLINACDSKPKDHVCVYPLPDPVKDGQCIGEQYAGSTPVIQTCVYKGFEWRCEWNFSGNMYFCKRGERIPPFAAEKMYPSSK